MSNAIDKLTKCFQDISPDVCSSLGAPYEPLKRLLEKTIIKRVMIKRHEKAINTFVLLIFATKKGYRFYFRTSASKELLEDATIATNSIFDMVNDYGEYLYKQTGGPRR